MLENNNPPPESVSIIAMVSAEPGSPLSVIMICKFLLPPSDTGASGFVISVTVALAVKLALYTPAEGDVMLRESVALLLIW